MVLRTFRTSGPASPVTPFASVTDSRPSRQANASTAACDSSSRTPSRAWKSRCSSLSSSSRTSASSKLLWALSFWMRGGTLPRRRQFLKMARTPVPACSLSPILRKAATIEGFRTSFAVGSSSSVRGSVGVPRIPEYRSVLIEPYERSASVGPIVLVDQLVDDRFAKGHIVGRVVVPPERLHVEPEGAVRMPQVSFRQDQPRLKQVLLHDDPVGPAVVGRPFGKAGADELAVDDRPGKNLPQVAGATEDQHGRPGRRQPVAALHHEAPLVQELDIGEALVPSGVAIEEGRPVPAHGIRVEELVGFQLAQHPAVVPVFGGVPQEMLQFASAASLVATATAG